MAFFMCVIVVILIVLPFSIEVYRSVSEFIENKPTDYRWPQNSDFWFTLITAFVFWSLEKVFVVALYPWYYKICKEKKNEKIRDVKTRKGVTNIYKCLYYTSAAFYGWYVLKDSYILPPYLGGKGSLYNLFVDFPYINHHPIYRFYFTGTMGYHLGSLVH